MFEININNQATYYHSFTTDDKALQAIGMASYNANGIHKYLNKDNPDVKEFFGDDIDKADKALTGEGDSAKNMAMLRINDKETGQYFYIEGLQVLQTVNGTQAFASIPILLERHQEVQTGTITTPLTKDEEEVINNILTSQSGCINFTAQFTTLGCLRTARIRLYLKTRKNNKTSRTVAQHGDMLFTSVPMTAAGTPFSWGATSDLPVGEYAPPREGGLNNPINAVAAPLRMNYNASIGQYESGTQQSYAVLLQDLDAPTRPKLSGDVNTVDIAEFYDPSSPYYQGAFKTGFAMMVSVESGNPHMFGPNELGGCGEGSSSKKEKIEVINRSNRSYKQGDLVVVSMIGSEWCVVGGDGSSPSSVLPTSTTMKGWAFQKFISERAGLFHLGYTNSTGSFSVAVSPSTYERLNKYFYYLKALEGKTTNVAIIKTFFPVSDTISDEEKVKFQRIFTSLSNRTCRQTTIFDQLGPSMGGVAPATFIGRTNIRYSPDNIPLDLNYGAPIGAMFPAFWGPVFPEGYTSTSTSPILAKIKAGTVSATAIGFNEATDAFLPFVKQTVDITNAFKDSESKVGDSSNRMFADKADRNYKQLPAEVALLGDPMSGSKFRAYGIQRADFLNSKIGTYTGWRYFLHEHPGGTLNSTNENRRYRWIFLETTPTGVDDVAIPVYGFKPINPNEIQFTPLSLEFALSETYIGDQNNFGREAILKTQINYLHGTYTERQNLLGTTFAAREEVTIPSPNNNTNEYGVTAAINFGPFIPTLKDYEAETIHRNSTAPMGGPGLIRDTEGSERSNVAGVIASNTTFTATTSIQFVVLQYFGLTPKSTVSGFSDLSVSTIGGMMWSSGGSNASIRSIPQWGDGSRSDSYDSYGTTALHVRIFDSWPIEDTVYDGRYFAVFHFNPSVPIYKVIRKAKVLKIMTASKLVGTFDEASIEDRSVEPDKVATMTVDTGLKAPDPAWVAKIPILVDGKSTYNLDGTLKFNYPTLPKIERHVDIIETTVDFKEPSYRTGTSTTSERLPVGGVVDIHGIIAADQKLANYSEWRVNGSRRGLMLGGSTVNDDGGIIYPARTFGIRRNIKIAELSLTSTKMTYEGGSGYAVGDQIEIKGGTKQAIVKVLTVEDVAAIPASLPNAIPAYAGRPERKGSVATIAVLTVDGEAQVGEGYMTIDMGFVEGKTLTGTGSGAKIDVKELEVYEAIRKDIGPRERCPITRLTSPSTATRKGAVSGTEGKFPVEGSETTNIALREGTHEYDAFFFFHNDIGHTLSYETAYSPGIQQYVTLTIK